MAYIRRFRGRRRFNRRKPRLYRRNRRYGRRRGMASKKWPVLGLTHSASLVYTETVSLDPAAGVSADHVFRANDCFDPNSTGAGHQPMGYDQMMALYSHFCVTGSKIQVFTCGAQGGAYYAAVALRGDNTSMGGQTIDQIAEQPQTSFRLIYQGGDYQLARGNVLTKKFSAKRFFRTRDPVGDEQYNGTAAASPAEMAYYHVMLAPIAAENLSAQSVFVKIQYHVVFSEPKILAQS